MFEGNIPIRTVGEVGRKLDRFNRFLRGDSRDKAMEAFFGNEVWPALEDAAGNFHFMARNPGCYSLDGPGSPAYELAARISAGPRLSFGGELKYALSGCCVEMTPGLAMLADARFMV